MAVVIRLRRMGHKKSPFYRMVVADSRCKRDGRFLETVGTYNPIAQGGTVTTLKQDRIVYWLSVGARPTETAWSIIKKAGIKEKSPKPAVAKEA